MPEICIRYGVRCGRDLAKICLDLVELHLMLIFAFDLPEICLKYASDMPEMQLNFPITTSQPL